METSSGQPLTGCETREKHGNRSLNLRHAQEGKTLASNQRDDYVTAILGDEYDDQLRARLLAALRRMGAVASDSSSRSLAGSQEIEAFDVTIDGRPIHIEAETYIGLSVSGPQDIVNRIKEQVSA